MVGMKTTTGGVVMTRDFSKVLAGPGELDFMLNLVRGGRENRQYYTLSDVAETCQDKLEFGIISVMVLKEDEKPEEFKLLPRVFRLQLLQIGAMSPGYIYEVAYSLKTRTGVVLGVSAVDVHQSMALHSAT